MHAILYTDGGSRGNPGHGAEGVVLLDTDGKLLAIDAAYSGDSVTNNQAEYMALLRGLKLAEKSGYKAIEVRMDSELVVKQLIGEYKVKNENMQPLYKKVMAVVGKFDSVEFSHIPRADNHIADKLVNTVLDAKLK